MRSQAVVWPCLDRDTNTLGLGLLRESNGLIDVGTGEAREGVVKLGDEGVAVRFGHRHECTSHDAALAGSKSAQQRAHARPTLSYGKNGSHDFDLCE